MILFLARVAMSAIINKRNKLGFILKKRSAPEFIRMSATTPIKRRKRKEEKFFINYGNVVSIVTVRSASKETGNSILAICHNFFSSSRTDLIDPSMV